MTAPPNGLLKWLSDRTEAGGAVTLAVAALLTTWCSYQSALWDGDQSAAYTRAGEIRTTASRREVQAGQIEGADVLLFTQWLDAHAAGDRKLEAFYKTRFRPEYLAAHEAWLAQNPLDDPEAPRTPFASPAYHLTARDEGDALERQAAEVFNEGEKANRISDDFVRAGVILAGAMFFGGIGQVFENPRVRIALLGIAVLQCAGGIFLLSRLPIN